MNDTLDVLGAPMIVKSGGGPVAVFLADHPIPPGYFVPPHRHDADDEMLFVVEGELTLIGEAGESKAPAGTCSTFARGDLHGFRNDTAGTVRLIVIATPGVQSAEMFRHFDRVAKAADAPLALATVMAIAGEYGVHFG